MNDQQYWIDFSRCCRDELLENVMPFWMKSGWDRKNGGVYTCLDRDGSLMDSTKSVWFQGRFGWMTAFAYNHVKKCRSWITASKSCCEFLERHCFDRDMPIKYLPIKFDKLRLKLEAAQRAGVEKAITFEFSHFMSPQSCYSAAAGLYDRYCEYFEIKQ